MRPKTAFALLILAIAMWQPHLPLGNAEGAITEVILFAHTDPAATSVSGRVLGIIANATSQQSADVRDGIDFTLVPSLSGPLHLLGRIDVYVWLAAPESIRGTLQVAIMEVASNSSVAEISSASVTVSLPSTPYQVIFGLGAVDYTTASGSSLRLEVRFSPTRTVPVKILWDAPTTATRLVIRAESVPKLDLEIADLHGKSGVVFPASDAESVQLFAAVTIEDPFYGTSIRFVSLYLTNSSGGFLIEDAPMNLTSQSESPFRLKYELPIAAYPGRYNVTIRVIDAVGRTFSTSKEILVTRYLALDIILVDSQQRPAVGLDISLSSDNHLIEQARSDSGGLASVRVPSTLEVGPFVLQIRQNNTLLLVKTIEVESDSVLRLEVPLYDWDVRLAFDILGLPLSDTTLRLYLNGTYVASSRTDAKGVARFASMPFGTYRVETAPIPILGPRSFENVTHSPSPDTTTLTISLLQDISDSTLLIIASLFLFVVFGVIAVSREKARTRRFKHIAELLGGRFPESSIIMLVGPSGSGKSLLLHNILADSLEAGRPCLCISNSELPSRIRDNLSRQGVNVQRSEDQNKLRFIDAYSSETGAVSVEKHSVASLGDLTALGIEITRCSDELGSPLDVFLDSITPIVSSGDSGRALSFIRHYAARTTKSGGNFAYTASATMEAQAIARLEEASDCVLQTEKSISQGKLLGRLLIKKARGVAHERDWLDLRVSNKGRLEFLIPPHR